MIYNTLHYTVQYIQFCKYSKRNLIGKINLLLQFKQGAFAVDAGGVAGERAVGADDAVARDDDGDGVVAYSAAHSLRRAASETAGQLAVGQRLAVGDGKQCLPYSLLKEGTLQCQWWYKLGLVARKVFIKPTADLFENRQRCMFLMLHSQHATEVLLSVKPKTHQHLSVAGQRDAPERRVIM